MIIKQTKIGSTVVTLSSDSNKTIFTIKAVAENEVIFTQEVDMIPFLFEVGVAQDMAYEKAMQIFNNVVDEQNKKSGVNNMLNLELFQSRNNRTIVDGQLVGVHWNSHKNCWSIVSMKSRKSTGVVLGYASNITLEDVSFHIDKSKQKYVKENLKKERHAFVVGKIVSFECTDEKIEMPLYYNPLKVDTFVDGISYHARGVVFPLDGAMVTKLRDEDGKPVVTYIGSIIRKIAN